MNPFSVTELVKTPRLAVSNVIVFARAGKTRALATTVTAPAA